MLVVYIFVGQDTLLRLTQVLLGYLPWLFSLIGGQFPRRREKVM